MISTLSMIASIASLAGGASARFCENWPRVMISSRAPRARETRLFIVPSAQSQMLAASS